MKRIFILYVFLLMSLYGYSTGDNIAKFAKISVSSEIKAYPCTNLVDGNIRIYDKGEWRSKAGANFWGGIYYPSLRLEWNEKKFINEVVLYDRPNMNSHMAGGLLKFDDGSEIEVYEIPNDGSPKSIKFPAKEVKWLEFECCDADGQQIGLSEIEVYTSIESSLDYVSKVNPFIETSLGRYFFFVTGSQPFGMISAAPLTRNKNQCGGGYNYNSTEILGFPQVHGWMLSGVSLMPTTGEVNPIKGEKFWKSSFRHQGEIVRPGYHRVFLEKYNLWVEQTASDRVSFYKLKYGGKEDTNLNVLLNLGGYLSTTTMIGAEVKKVSDTVIEGEVTTAGRLWGGPDKVKIYFSIKMNKPMIGMDGWDDQNLMKDVVTVEGTGDIIPRNSGMTYYDAPGTGVGLKYKVKTDDELLVKCAISYTSIKNARLNLNSEIKHWNFEQACDDSRKEWNEYLGRIEVKGGTPQQQEKFYTDLWHVLLGRHKIDDVTGDYPDYTDGKTIKSKTVDIRYKTRTLPLDENGNAKFHMYNSDAFWLTQWNLNILWGMAWPEVQDDFAACLVQYAKNGGLLPRGPNAGGYSYIMIGCPATSLITSAYQKGILTKISAKEALKHMVRNHQDGMMEKSDQIKYYEKHGHFNENASLTLESNFQDWALAQMAKKMGYNKYYSHFIKRSEGWKTLFNKEQKLIFPKKDGEWLHTNPLNGNGWIEANAWQATWSISHAIPELVQMMGGNDSLCMKLNYAFEQAEDESFIYGYSDGYICYANQPSCSNAHVFNYAGAPWLSQYWVRQVNEKTFGGTTPGKGYGGHDEDQGQMGGISALMSMGLFSLKGTCSIDPVYDITSPVFDEIKIKLNPAYYEGKEFIIKVNNNSSKNCYIDHMLFNDKPYNEYRIYHKDFVKGGTLELWMKNTPNK